MTSSVIPWKLTRELEHKRDLLVELVVRDLKLRYKRSYLGIAWTLVHPLIQLGVYTFVFQVLFRVETPHFMIYLFIGITCWTWTQASVLEGTMAIVANRDLIRQPGFPAALLPNVAVGSHLLHFLLTLPITFAMIYFSWELTITPAILWLPLVILVQYLFTVTFSLLAACVHVNFRDTQYLLSVVLMMGFFLTPIIYEVSMVPEQYRWVYHLNPMTYIVDAYRAPLLRGEMPDLAALGGVAAASAGLLRLFYLLFRRVSGSFVEEF
jgi:lipopolysaccharide transport system permease protein